MRYALHCHPANPCLALRAVEVELRPSAAHLVLRYSLLGDPAALRIDPPGEAQRKDGLWQHTCCELFVGSAADERYYEFNFSPSTAWAAYVFSGYRQGMRPVPVTPPNIRIAAFDEQWALEARVNFAELNVAEARLAMSAVVEELDGRKSYWALKHPGEHPDFHQPDGFIATL